MKRLLASFGVVMFVAVVAVDAGAQQRPQPLPTQTGTDGTAGTTTTTQQVLPPLHFPAPASTYNQYVNYFLDLLRKPSKLRLSAGEADKIIVAFKDCAMRVESDGYVTSSEYHYCRNIYKTMLKEAATPIVTQAAASGGGASGAH